MKAFFTVLVIAIAFVITSVAYPERYLVVTKNHETFYVQRRCGWMYKHTYTIPYKSALEARQDITNYWAVHVTKYEVVP